MGYHPETLAFSFPPYPRGRRKLGEREPWSFGGALYALKPWIGFDVWHIDPERPTAGQRTDDSCGWFDRWPREYADAVAYVLKDTEAMHEIKRALMTRCSVTGAYGHTYPRMPQGETLAVCLMVARYLELRRWWNGQDGKGGAHASTLRRLFTRKRNVDSVAFDLALDPLDNLSSTEEPETLVRLIAAAMHRRFKPWWKHPRWHVHHWRVNFDLVRNLKRMLQPCATCRKPLGFGYCPIDDGMGLHHHECLGVSLSGNMGVDPDPHLS
jgi:hypothetical protein